ncbi:hypothetical protein LCGC14_1187400 [marine sediment metagenome]|uniref:Uncharacterized protein n=1 Tax=marine sediment metagenome TaxID=412755 RepID=A0A0F9LKF3_9ZZZZ
MNYVGNLSEIMRDVEVVENIFQKKIKYIDFLNLELDALNVQKKY